jgi:hypothetical protein
VPDPSSAVVPGASVAIKDNTKGTIHATKTDREGVYLFFSGAGAIADGYSRRFSKGDSSVTVLLGPPVTVNVALEIAKENTTVKVTNPLGTINGFAERFQHCPAGSNALCFAPIW